MSMKHGRKSSGSAILSCVNWKNSLVCIDLNGAMFNLAAGYRRNFSSIYKLSLAGKESLRFNILDEITGERAYQDASMMASIFLTHSGREAGGRSAGLVETAKDLLTGAILHSKCSDYRDKSMPGVLSFLSQIDNCGGNEDKYDIFFKNMINAFHCSREIHEIIVNIARRIRNLPQKRIKYIFGLVFNALKIFDDPVMRHFSGSSDFCLNGFKVSGRPVSLFITVPFSGLEMFFPYFAVMLNIINRSFLENETENIQRPVLMLFDDSLNKKQYLKSIANNYCDDITVCFSKLRLAEKKRGLYKFLYNKKIYLPAPKGRGELLLECSGTALPDYNLKKWFHIPEEMYMRSDHNFEPIFTSKVPDDGEPEQYNEKSPGKNNYNKYKLKYTELIRHENIETVDLFFNKEIKERLVNLESMLQEDNYLKIKKRLSEKSQKSGIICMLFGEPGTGKTESVMQLAKNTKRDLLKVDISLIRQRYVGASEKAVNNLFSEYKDIYENSNIAPILFINEADGLFQTRLGNIEASSNQTLALDFNTIQNMLLDKLENFEGIMIGTSNFMDNMDKALSRRILYKVNFTMPDKETQKLIWKHKLPEADGRDIEKLTNNFNFSGGLINNVIKNQNIDYVISGEEADYENLEKLCKMESQEKTVRKIGFAIA